MVCKNWIETHGKIKVKLYEAKYVPKSPKNRQMPIKHNKTNTYGDISALKGGWDLSPDQMLSDFKHTFTFHSQPAILLHWGKARGQHTLYRQITQCRSPQHTEMIFHTSEIVKYVSKENQNKSSYISTMIIRVNTAEIP